MSLLDTLRKNLTPEQLSAVQDALGDDFNYDVVPRSRLNKVIQQRDEARRQLSGSSNQNDDSDNGEGRVGSDGSGAGTGAVKGFTQADIDAAVQAEKDRSSTAITNMQKRYAASVKLRESNFVDPDLVLSAGLIDLDKITLDAVGTVTGGLDDQISSLAQSKPYMVGSNGGGQRGTGRNGAGEDFGSITSKEDFLKLPSDKQIEFKKANPEVFKGFMRS